MEFESYRNIETGEVADAAQAGGDDEHYRLVYTPERIRVPARHWLVRAPRQPYESDRVSVVSPEDFGRRFAPAGRA